MSDFAIYNGRAEYVYGVPARNLSREEWDSLSEGQRDVAVRSGVYTLVVDGGDTEKPAPRRSGKQEN